jgi:hypothetical protein
MTDNFPFPVSNEGATPPCELRDSEHSCRLPVSLRQVLKRLQSWVACKTWAPNGTPYPRSVQGERHVKCCSVQWHECSANRFTPAQLVTWVSPPFFLVFFQVVGYCGVLCTTECFCVFLFLPLGLVGTLDISLGLDGRRPEWMKGKSQVCLSSMIVILLIIITRSMLI